MVGSNPPRFKIFADVGVQLRCAAHSFVNQQRQQALPVSGEPEPFQSSLEGHHSHSHLINSVSDDRQRTCLAARGGSSMTTQS